MEENINEITKVVDEANKEIEEEIQKTKELVTPKEEKKQEVKKNQKKTKQENQKQENQESKEENKEKIKCSFCGSALVYMRLKTKEKVCRSCGFVEKLGEH
jgi:acetyl-CoA carboxylase beta subunit